MSGLCYRAPLILTRKKKKSQAYVLLSLLAHRSVYTTTPNFPLTNRHFISVVRLTSMDMPISNIADELILICTIVGDFRFKMEFKLGQV